jgi:hypothetical protein
MHTATYETYLLSSFFTRSQKGGLADPRLRASNDINDPSKLARYFFQGWRLIGLPLRVSNGGFLKPRVARAQTFIRLHPFSFSASD